jgi:hypothetical protein
MKAIGEVLRQQRIRVLALLAILVLLFIPTNGFEIIICPMQHFFSIPCPACGMTRSMSSLLEFEIWRSFHFHPLGFLVTTAIILSLVVNHTNFLYQRIFKKITIYSILVISFIVIWIYRLAF